MPEAGRRRTRVLTLVDVLWDGTGGAERFAAGLTAALPRDRCEPMLCVTRTASGYLRRMLVDTGVPVLELRRRGRADVLPFRRMAALLRRRQIDVIHCHMFGSNVWGSIIGRLTGVPVVIAQEHSWAYEGNPLRRLVDGWVIGRLADRFVAVSRHDRERMIQFEGVSPGKVVVVPTAYVPRDVPDGSGDLRAELGIPPGAPTIGTVTGLRPEKALPVLLDAFAELSRTLPDAHLILVGDGECRSELERRAAAAGLADQVHFTGVRNDLGNVFAALDVASISSDREGSPLFAFECMAHSTPLVATAVGGLVDLISDRQTGLLVPRRDPSRLAAALLSLLREPRRRELLARSARERLDDYGLERIAARFADLYERLRAERRRPRSSPLVASRWA